MLKVFFFLLSLFISSATFAYMEDYPPTINNQAQSYRLKAQLLVNYQKNDYISKEGLIKAHLKETANSFSFSLKVGDFTLVKMIEFGIPMPYAIYQADLNNDGLSDFIVFYNDRANGTPGVYEGKTEIFVNRGKKGFRKISYENLAGGIEDFVDMNHDGKYEVIIGDDEFIRDHMYFSYSIYELNDYKLLNVDQKYKGFPKFVWFTHKSNNKDTDRLKESERYRSVVEKNAAIKYEDL